MMDKDYTNITLQLSRNISVVVYRCNTRGDNVIHSIYKTTKAKSSRHIVGASLP